VLLASNLAMVSALLRATVLALILHTAFAAASAAPTIVLRGHVRDLTGAPIEGATVTDGNSTTHTGNDGEFSIVVNAESAGVSDVHRLKVTAPGFLTVETSSTNGSETVVTLPISRVETRVSVTADGANAPGATTLGRAELARAPVFGLDEALKQVPGFALFRRTPSWAANPTSQGVSLRGVGASGASRALVLLDGVPLNDPFGGWVYWGRVTPTTLSAAEVVEGGASDLYGTDAVGGALNLYREPRGSETQVRVETALANLATPQGSLSASTAWEKWQAGITVSAFRTDGYVPVPPSARGSVDAPANSRNAETSITVARNFGVGESNGRISLSGELYGEDRQNGTQLQTNGATIRTLTLGAERNGPSLGSLSVRAWGGSESLRQTFSAVSVDRNSESLTRNQGVPAAQAGMTAVWSRSVAGRHNVVAGTDVRWVAGESAEWAYAQQQITQRVRNGGSQRRAAVFGEDRIRLGHVLVTAALRLDHWSNYDGFSSTQVLRTGSVNASTLADRSETFASPKVAASWAAAKSLTLYASGGRAFRAPTLNELYRGFRVGNVITNANPALQAERATSVEAGATLAPTPRLRLRAGYWWLDMTRPVANVTVASTPQLVTRTRENLGRLRSQGFFASGELALNGKVQVRAAYQFADAIVTQFSANPALVGNWIPQVARHNATVQLLLSPIARTHISVDARWHGLQFDDDLNQFPLAGYPWIGGQVSRELTRRAEVFVSAENILNRRYEVGRTPTVTVGPPVMAMIGVRLTLGAR
jgi:outer membrane cobalamin receptor